MSKIYADVIIDIVHSDLDKSYQYAIPDHLINYINIGVPVYVPFGKGNIKKLGYIIKLSNKAQIDKAKIKSIIEIVEHKISIESTLIKLAVWMHKRYSTTMISALKTVLPINQKIKHKENKIIHLIINNEQAYQYIKQYEQKKYTAMVRVLKYLTKKPIVSTDELKKNVDFSNNTLKSLSKKQLIEIKSKTIYRKPYSIQTSKKTNIEPTKKQLLIIRKIINDYNNKVYKTYLLHGVTGSGKTEIYIRIIKEVLKLNKQVIILIPEISLTYQTVRRFYERFGDRVGLLHSKLSQGERYDQYIQALNGDIDIMIGPRSALFTPFKNLGFIIIDEEHESSYKSETNPKYHAKETAIKRAELSGASVLLGSATPSLESYYKAEQGEYELLELKQRVDDKSLPKVYIVDMREELKIGNKTMLSNSLREAIQKRLDKQEQVILFINRRGYSRFVSCRNCGFVLKCEHCDVAYTYHNNGKLICHYCGREKEKPSNCPNCKSTYIKQFGIGTQKVESYIKKEFTQARILRMDMDTTSKKNSHEKILSSFAKKEADILIGTQMIAKGHHFKDVTLVGVLAADLSLYVNDFRAGERTFALLTQVAGRAGRGEKEGEVYIQTYSPTHYSIQCSREQDYEKFYKEEIQYRKLMQYAPFTHSLVLLITCYKEDEVIKKASKLGDFIKYYTKDKNIDVTGPSQALISKINDIYRQVIYIKSNDYNQLLKVKSFIEHILDNNNEYNLILVHYDINPLHNY